MMREDERKGWVNTKTTDIVGMCLKLDDFLASVEIETPKHEIVTATDEPILSCNELAGSDWYICDFESLYDC